MRRETYAHIKRPRADGRSNCNDDALCGNVIGCAYITLDPHSQIPDTEFAPCPECALGHIEQHYKSIEEARDQPTA
jgi:hypothetical protein